MDARARDDQMIGKGTYIPAPSPGPPLDGSYYNMNSDRYLSYPPLAPLVCILTVALFNAHIGDSIENYHFFVGLQWYGVYNNTTIVGIIEAAINQWRWYTKTWP